MLLPRMLLHRPPGGGLISKEKLVGRFEMFARGVDPIVESQRHV